MSNENKTIGLALSGGGVRAAVFHIGVLRWLAENNKFENVSHLSTVSGGTLLTGLIFYLNHYQWPSSSVYMNIIHPNLRRILTQTDLQSALIKKTFNPMNWRYFLSRATILAKAIESCWGIKGVLSDLGLFPIWSANATTLENGRRFRFKQDSCGDYELGYASATNFKIAEIMAMSAAVPCLIGPLIINPLNFEWRKRENWDDHIDTAAIIQQPYKRLHAYDGGLYDNLGVEPLFDVGRHQIKDENIDMLLVSDAGSPLQRKSYYCNPIRLLRIVNIIAEQSRSLRVRSISSYLQTSNGGLYFQIGSNPRLKIKQHSAHNEVVCEKLMLESWLDPTSIKRIAEFPTNLKQITTEHFDLIERHGYETNKWNSIVFGL